MKPHKLQTIDTITLEDKGLSITIVDYSITLCTFNKLSNIIWDIAYTPMQMLNIIEIYKNMDKTELYKNSPDKALMVDRKIMNNMVLILIESCNKHDFN
jgi:hypothetical protein